MATPHQPVLLRQVIEGLAPRSGRKYIDCTIGAGGHASAILEASSPNGVLLGLDGDPDSLALARSTLASYKNRTVLVLSNFTQLESVAAEYDFIPAHGVILDLGLSSMQLANAGRGFSFASETLDMRMDPSTSTRAADLVNGLDEQALADLIFKYGEERAARRIARAVVRARPIESASGLARVIEAAIGRHSRIHPATRTFQALRIAVNNELENLQAVLPQLARVLSPGGRAAVITFHSLEDRIVKRFFKSSREFEIVNKHTIKPERNEVAANPRARSAQLRLAERI